MEDAWFQMDYVPALAYECEEGKDDADDVRAVYPSEQDMEADKQMPKSSSFINAFQLIAMSQDLDLSGLFEEKDEVKEKVMLVSDHAIDDTMTKIQAAAADANLLAERSNNKMKMYPSGKLPRRSPRSYFFNLSAEFCKSLSSLLKGKLMSCVAAQAEEC
ncbi:hypothetical protein SAY87_008643 [Trapa incisa]|uniref:NAF domain-containing protein n=1 Tax=Trapa incisa TaxID=236973 RepID=A0AAN7JVL5_9MYRT|nr:hypothetical protein SAY87_008643 [Trapa incisa]